MLFGFIYPAAANVVDMVYSYGNLCIVISSTTSQFIVLSTHGMLFFQLWEFRGKFGAFCYGSWTHYEETTPVESVYQQLLLVSIAKDKYCKF